MLLTDCWRKFCAFNGLLEKILCFLTDCWRKFCAFNGSLEKF
jgi:hypothetical protein